MATVVRPRKNPLKKLPFYGKNGKEDTDVVPYLFRRITTSYI